MRIYLDYNSTTPCAPEVVNKMLPFFSNEFGNAASLHEAGREALTAIDDARDQIARALSTSPEKVYFTGSATESNNISLLGLINSNKQRRKIAVSSIEHKSILEPAKQLENNGYTIVFLPVDRNGMINLNAAKELIDEQTLLVSVQGANNETGVIQPIREIVKLAHACGTIFHCDAVQMFGKIPFDIEELRIDLASFSAHKIYGPKGIGALFIANGKIAKIIKPIFYGGKQEKGLRPGTQNVPAIVGFGCASQIIGNSLKSEMNHIRTLREKMENKLIKNIPEIVVNGQNASRVPGTISLTISGIPSDMLIANLTNVCVSNGSACNSGALEPSHVLLAMKLRQEEAENTIRISIGRYTTEIDIENAYHEILHAVNKLRSKTFHNKKLNSMLGG